MRTRTRRTQSITRHIIITKLYIILNDFDTISYVKYIIIIIRLIFIRLLEDIHFK